MESFLNHYVDDKKELRSSFLLLLQNKQFVEYCYKHYGLKFIEESPEDVGLLICLFCVNEEIKNDINSKKLYFAIIAKGKLEPIDFKALSKLMDGCPAVQQIVLDSNLMQNLDKYLDYRIEMLQFISILL